MLTSLLRNNALVAREFPCRNLVLEHFINFFKRAILGLRNEKEDEDCGDEIRPEPDIAILGTPVEIQGIDEVRGGECADPTKQESGTGTKSERIGTETLGRDFASNEPCNWTSPATVEEDVDADEGNETLEGSWRGGGSGVDDGDDKHGECLNSEGHDEDSTPR